MEHSHDAPTAERLTELESRLAYLERTVEQLNDVLIEVRNEQDRLQRENLELRAQLEKVEAGASPDGSSEPPPPHY